MRIKSILASMLAIAALAGCAKDNNGPSNTVTGGEEGDHAYVSLTISTSRGAGTRAGSDEKPAILKEADINNLYLLTFDANKKLLKHEGTNLYCHAGTGDLTPGTGVVETKVFRIADASKYALVIANPGKKLSTFITSGLYQAMPFSTLNAEILLDYARATGTKTMVTELHAGAAGTAAYEHFTMINAGTDVSASDITSGTVTGTAATDLLIDITDYMANESEYPTIAEAESAAKANRCKIDIERLTSKIQVTKATTVEFEGGATTSKLPVEFWTLDVLNRKFFPLADKKYLLPANHSTGGEYNSAFYTVDPNYGAYNSTNANYGIAYNSLKTSAYLAPAVSWLATEAYDYAVENTMEPDEMLFQNVTRLVIKAYYWPKYEEKTPGIGNWYKESSVKDDGDWFRYAGKNYAEIEEIQEHLGQFADIDPTTGAITIKAGSETDANIAFVDACNSFADKLHEWFGLGVKFGKLTSNILEGISVTTGGELVKDPEGCIRWYQNGLNYYYYEIVHDSNVHESAASQNVLSENEYGVVRNNWYALTLTKISGHGTPWYPSVVPPSDPSNPDPNDPAPDPDPEFPDPKPDPVDPEDPTPHPTDPVEQGFSRIAFEVTVKPWIHWSNNIEI